jgi:hypothetical protein
MICLHVIAAAGLRWLGGDDKKSIEDTFHHLSLASAQRIVNRFLQAVIDCDHQDCVIELPSDDELEAIAQVWSILPTAGGSMFGCVCAIDGIFSPRSSNQMLNSLKTISQTIRAAAASASLQISIILAALILCSCNDFRAYWCCHKLKEWIDRLKDIRDG